MRAVFSPYRHAHRNVLLSRPALKLTCKIQDDRYHGYAFVLIHILVLMGYDYGSLSFFFYCKEQISKKIENIE